MDCMPEEKSTFTNPVMRSLRKLIRWPEEKSGRNARASERSEVQYEATFYDPAGPLPVRGVDIHEFGAGIRSKKPLTPGSSVFVHLKDFKMVASAEVRHCMSRGPLGYFIGLKFSRGSLKPVDDTMKLQNVEKSAERGWTDEFEPSGD